MSVAGGSRVDDIEYYDTDADAKKRIEEFNSKNTKETVPDWYMVAVLGDVVEVSD